MSTNDVSRVIQGVATGIGFIGAGAILKRKDDSEIQGLTTAAGIWLTAAAGLAAGLGRLGPGLGGRLPRVGNPSGGRENRCEVDSAAHALTARRRVTQK